LPKEQQKELNLIIQFKNIDEKEYKKNLEEKKMIEKQLEEEEEENFINITPTNI